MVERDDAGAPTGVLRETAAWDAAAAIPCRGERELDAAVAHGLGVAHARGVDGIHDFQREHGLAAWQRLNADRRLSLRVWASLPAERLDEIIALGLRSGLGDEWLRIGPVKAFADGTLGSRTAWMLEPFSDAGRGESLLGAGELRVSRAGARTRASISRCTPSATPPTAPSSTRSRPRASAGRPRPASAHRARAAAGPGRPRALRRARRDRLDAAVARALRPRAGEAVWGERCAGAYALGSLAASGAPLCFGSDAPIEPLDPLAGVQAAATRDWPVAEALPVELALDGFWSGAAHARHAERRLGRLLPGYAADLVVLERDPVTCPPDEIAGIAVVATMGGGRWVHGRPPW